MTGVGTDRFVASNGIAVWLDGEGAIRHSHEDTLRVNPAEVTQAFREFFIHLEYDFSTEGAELRRWWMTTAASEVDPMVQKMVEYGGMGRAIDLEEIGRGLVHSGVQVKSELLRENGEPQDGHLQELGVYFYLLGKFARWTAAVAEGRLVSDDTLLDIGVYVRMAQRIRQSGGWPV